jgi:hypothetical protein
LSEQPPKVSDFLVWVGGRSYSRESFIKEAKKMGVCRRVPFVPTGVVKGISRVFLISDMSDEDRKKYNDELSKRDKDRYQQQKLKTGQTTHVTGDMPRGRSMIFAYFIIRSIIYVVGPGVDVDKELMERGIDVLEYQEGDFGFNDERGCGSLQIGGTYFLSEEDMEKIKDLAESSGLDGQIEVFKVALPYTGVRFRGVRSLLQERGDSILEMAERMKK